jgi:hypothetical protein
MKSPRQLQAELDAANEENQKLKLQREIDAVNAEIRRLKWFQLQRDVGAFPAKVRALMEARHADLQKTGF